MKKLFLLVAVTALTATVANAQLGFDAGYVNSANRLKEGNEIEKQNAMHGFFVGAHYDIGLFSGLSIQPGLNYSYMGNRESISESGVTVKTSWREHFLNVPVDVKYTFDISNDLKVFAFAGPRVVFGLSGVTKVSAKIGGEEASLSYNLYSGNITTTGFDLSDFVDPEDFSSDGMLSRFDLQLGLGAGAQFRAFSLKFGYDWGLINRLKGDTDGATMKRGQFYVGVGYNF